MDQGRNTSVVFFKKDFHIKLLYDDICYKSHHSKTKNIDTWYISITVLSYETVILLFTPDKHHMPFCDFRPVTPIIDYR
jgi:hypothetical protein